MVRPRLNEIIGREGVLRTEGVESAQVIHIERSALKDVSSARLAIWAIEFGGEATPTRRTDQRHINGIPIGVR